MDQTIELTFDIFGETNQRATVDTSLTVAELMREILRAFEALDEKDLPTYALRLAASAQPLEPGQTLMAQGVQPGDRLVLGWVEQAKDSARRPLSRLGQAALQDATTGTVYAIEWQPARLGRRDTDAAHNELLLVNFDWHPDGQRVSRQHAQVTERQGVYYLESLAPRNPTLLNGKVLTAGETARLRSGDTIRLGQSAIVLRFVRP